MEIGFGDALLIVGGLLAVAAALSGVMRGTVLSISVLSVALGIVLAKTNLVSVDARDPAIVDLIELAFFLILAQPGGDAGGEAAKLLGEAAFGAFVGVVVGLVGGRLHHHLPGGGITARYEGMYAIGFGLAAFGLADVTIGNGLIAAFVAGITMGVAEHEITDAFVEFAENVSAIFQVVT